MVALWMWVSGVMGSPQFIFVTVLLYFLAHFAVCLWSLVWYWGEVCYYEYHYLLCVWMVRDILGIRILHWQTHAEATEPSTFDRFIKNWWLTPHTPTPHTHTLQSVSGHRHVSSSCHCPCFCAVSGWT